MVSGRTTERGGGLHIPFTKLDPRTALIVVDLQKGLLSYQTARPMAEVVAVAGELAMAFRERGLPVALVNVASGPKTRSDKPSVVGELTPELMTFAPELGQDARDIVVTKRGWGAFTDTGLEARLREVGVTQVVVVGVATSIGVESTARQAQELGFNVCLPLDATTDASAEAYENSATRIFPRIGETGTTQELLALLHDAHT